jgi:hypothetical protein
VEFRARAQDVDSNLDYLAVFRRPWNPSNQTFSDPATQIGSNQSCTSNPGSCTRTVNWATTNSHAGWWVLYPNVFDTDADRCTGRPYEPSGWADCDPVRTEPNDRDNVKILINRTPTCSNFRGPTQLSPGQLGVFHPVGQDLDSNQVRYFRWNSSCGGTFPNVSSIRVRARGTTYNGVGARMRVVTGDSDTGTRTTHCTYTFAGLTTRTCSLSGSPQISSLDLVFDNKASGGGEDRNLYVEWVEFVLSDGTVRRVNANSQNTSGDYVIYDRGLLDLAYDGLNLGAIGAGSEVAMTENGSLRFPVPWRAPSSPNSSCSLTVSLRDNYHFGALCSKPVNVCGVRPDEFTLNYPGNGDVLDYADLEEYLTFDWHDVTNWRSACTGFQRRYKLYLDKNDGTGMNAVCTITEAGGNPPASECDIAAVNFMPGVSYQWKVRAINTTAYDELNPDDTHYRDSPTWPFSFVDYGFPWYTALGGGEVVSHGLGIDPPGTVNSNWDPPYMVRGTLGAALSTSGIVFYELDDEGELIPVTESKVYAEHIPGTINLFWPNNKNYSNFTPPVGAVEIVNRGDLVNSPFLDPGKVYYTNNSQIFVDATSSAMYRLSSNGVAVLYYTGSSPLVMTHGVLYHPSGTGTNTKLLLVTNAHIEIDNASTTGEASPLQSTTPNIRMGIITTGDITFYGKEDKNDTTLISEGPLIARNIEFGRSRRNMSPPNSHPSHVVRYNFRHLYYLTARERASLVPNFTGLFDSVIIWEGER